MHLQSMNEQPKMCSNFNDETNSQKCVLKPKNKLQMCSNNLTTEETVLGERYI